MPQNWVDRIKAGPPAAAMRSFTRLKLAHDSRKPRTKNDEPRTLLPFALKTLSDGLFMLIIRLLDSVRPLRYS